MKYFTALLLVLIFSSTSSAQVPSYLPQDGLVAWYPFDGNANDESGNGINTSVNGATLVSDRFGASNSAYLFDGVDDYLESELDATSSVVGHTQGTLSLWFNSTLDNGNRTLISIGNDEGRNDEMILSIPAFSTGLNQTFPALFRVTQGNEGIAYSHLLQMNADQNIEQFLFDGNWHHLVVIIEVGQNRIYIDGQEIAVGFIVGDVFTQAFSNILEPKSLTIGAEYNWEDIGAVHRHFEGQIDDVAIYNRGLAPDEIIALYESNDGSQTCIPSYLQTTDLVAYYPFCGNANDGSGNNLNGVVEGPNLVSDRNGEPNSAYYFNGTGDRINVEHNNLLNFQAGGELTVSYWIQGTPDPSNVDHIISKQTGSGSDQVGWNCALQQNTSEPTFVIKNGNGSNQCLSNSGETVLTDEWYNVVSVYDGSVTRIYMNGILTSETECVTEIGDNSNSLQIGSCDWATTFPNVVSFTGIIDDVAIYNRALTYYEISEMYDGSLTECVPDYLPTNELVAWYPFCGDADDESGNGLHGAAYGATLAPDRNGLIDAAYSLNGVSDYIEVMDTELLDFGADNFSISFWVKKDAPSISGNRQGVNKWFGENSEFNEWNLSLGSVDTDAPLFSIATDQGNYVASSPLDLPLDTWANIIGVRNDDFILIYQNGILMATTNVGNAVLQNTGSNLLMGTIQAGIDGADADLFSAACIDDIAIYSRALNPAEITSISSSTPLGVCSTCDINWAQGDLDCDGQVATSDLLFFLVNFGTIIQE